MLGHCSSSSMYVMYQPIKPLSHNAQYGNYRLTTQDCDEHSV